MIDYQNNSEGFCENYEDALRHKYVIRRVSPTNKHWWNGFWEKENLIRFIEKHIDDGNETHEVICNSAENVRHMLFFDLDAPCELFNTELLKFSNFIKLLHLKLLRIMPYGVTKPKILRCDRDGKYSAHLIYNVSIQSNHAKCIPYYIISEMRKTLEDMGFDGKLTNIIDTNVYNSMSSMRIMGSPKCAGGKTANPFILNEIGEKFDPDTLIMRCFDELSNIGSNRDKVINYECSTDMCFVKMSGSKPKPDINVESDVMEAAKKLIEEKHKNLTAVGIKNNMIILRDDHSANCIQCGRTHQNENPYSIVCKNGDVRLICRRNNDSGILVGNVTAAPDAPKTKRRSIKRILLEKLVWMNRARTNIKNPGRITKFRYLPEMLDVIADKRHVAISSTMGSGKTKALFEFIKIMKEQDLIVSIVHRRSLTANMRSKYKEAGFTIYDEIDGEINLIKHKRVLIQYESLHRLNVNGRISLLIADEVNSVCMQYLSKLSTTHRKINEYMLESVFKSSAASVLLDGNLNDYIINAVNCIGSREYFVWQNDSTELLNPNVIISEKDSAFKSKLVELLQQGNKIDVAASNGPNYCETLKAFILQQIPTAKVLTIHSETEDKELYTADVEAIWTQYDCVIRSPTVGAGVDFSVPYFDYCFVDVNSSGPLADDILQSMRRSRHIKTNTYYVNFGKCAILNLPTTYNDVLNQAENALAHNLTAAMLPDFDGKITDGRFKFRDLNNPLLKFDIWCRVYQNKQKNNVIKRIMEGLVRMGAKFQFLEDISDAENKTVSKILETISADLKAVDAQAVANAAELSEEEFTAKITASKISKQDRSAINKYVLRARYRYSDPIDLEWVKKYSDKKVLLMNKHIATRDVDIGRLGLFSEIAFDNATDVQKLDKCKTSFMYNVARIKARDIFDKYNKTAEFPAKLTEFINKQIDINNPVFGNKKLNGVRLKCSLAAINDVLNVLGYDIRIKRVFKQTTDGTKIYEYEWYDMAPEYYCIPDKTEKDNKKPVLPISYMLD